MADASNQPVYGNRDEDHNHAKADVRPHSENTAMSDRMTASRLDLSHRRVVAIVPAYNEERFIGSVVLMTQHYANTIIVVDDGSNDATTDVAAAAGAKVLRHPKNRGKAQALNTAFEAALEYKPDVVVTLDADGQHCPNEIAALIGPILRKEADMVIGSRYLGTTCRVPLHRILGHRFFNWLTRASCGVKTTDSQSGFRAFSPQALTCAKFHSQGFSVESEMQFIAGQRALRVMEVPVTIRYTDQPKRPVIQHGLQVLNGVFKLTGQYRPALYFGLPGLALFLGGLGWGAVVVERYTLSHQLAVGYALMCLLLTVAGLIMTSTAFTLHSVRRLLVDWLQANEGD
jgi:glycosyltransferase involved in cell wall biosynthesis